MAEFVERIMHLTRGPNKEGEWGFGVWHGLVSRRQATYVLAPEGIFSSLTIKRVAEQDMWKAEDVLAMRRTIRDGEDAYTHRCRTSRTRRCVTTATTRRTTAGQEFFRTTERQHPTWVHGRVQKLHRHQDAETTTRTHRGGPSAYC